MTGDLTLADELMMNENTMKENWMDQSYHA
jgi:hypothetical protein